MQRSNTARRLTATLPFASILALAHPAAATPYTASITIADTSSQFGYDVHNNTTAAASSGASASINLASGPTLTAYGTSEGSFNGALPFLSYAFSFTGPVGVTSAQIDITYSYDFQGAPSTSSNATGGAILLKFSNNQQVYVLDDHTFGHDFATDAVFSTSIAAGTTTRVTLTAAAYGAGSSAFLDPTISVDPAFLATNGYDASQFTFTLTPGIANGVAADVPEPMSLALLGPALVAATIRRRTRPA